MLNEFIQSFTTNKYAISAIYLAIFFILIRVGVFLLEKVILKLTMKTETDLDDLILKKSQRPLTWIAFFVGLRVSIGFLGLEETILGYANLIIDSLIGIVTATLLYHIFDISFSRVYKKVAKKTHAKTNEAMTQLTKGFLKVILISASCIYLLGIWGIEIGPLLTGLGIGGVAIAFALQSSLGNVFGGVSMILDKSVNVGDLVNLDDGTAGKIVKIGLRSTKIKTFDNEIVIVPNSKLSESNIKNVAQPEPKTRVVVPFNVAYGTDVDKVKKMILKEIKKVKGYVEEPGAHIKFLEMADHSLLLKAYFYVETFDVKLTALDDANTRIYNTLNKAKIEIPFPQMDVHMKKK